MAEYEMHVDDLLRYESEFVGKTLYAKGGHCEKLTMSLLVRKAAQYPEWYKETKCQVAGYKHLTNFEYLAKFVGKGYFVADCCGLIKGIRAGYRADGTEGKMTTEIDQTIKSMVKGLKDVVKDVKSAPEGYMAFFEDNTHVMTISKAGESDIESSPKINGVREVPIGTQPLSRVGGAGKLPWVDYRPKKEKLTEDGVWGMKTTRRAQEVFKTTQDGIVSRQLRRFKNRCAGCGSGWQWTGVSSDRGSELIRTMQKWLKVTADGHFGTKTIEALQKRMGTTVDGVLSNPSPCIKAFQKWLNEQ